jgi:hypothetical protein
LTPPWRSRRWRPLTLAGASGLLALTGLLASCGGGGDGTPAGAGPNAGDLVGYCALSQQLNTSTTAPTPTEVRELIRLAPPEIKADVTTFLSAGETSDVGVQASSRIFEYESSHC